MEASFKPPQNGAAFHNRNFSEVFSFTITTRTNLVFKYFYTRIIHALTVCEGNTLADYRFHVSAQIKDCAARCVDLKSLVTE